MIDYTILYKLELNPEHDWTESTNWDIFISAFTPTERVIGVFDRVHATRKDWLIIPEYKLASKNYPSSSNVYTYNSSDDEADYCSNYLSQLGLQLCTRRIGLDITGFVKPYAMSLIMQLIDAGISQLDIMYSEPLIYRHRENTKFSDEVVLEVRQVAGYEGVHTSNTTCDLLILGAGYDSVLLSAVANYKNQAQKMQMFGFPPLQPDMYQENVWRAAEASEPLGIHKSMDSLNLLAPANDPFVTASILSEVVENRRVLEEDRTNLYLCPLATEAQALGFTLFYLTECRNKTVSMIYPFCESYPAGTSIGLSKAWVYRLEILTDS